MSICSGLDLVDKQFIKFLNKDLIHNGFKYKLGENIDILPFNPTGKCSKGGLYFIKKNYLFDYIDMMNDSEFIANVTLEPNESIYIEDRQYKSHKIIITQITPKCAYLNNLTDNELVTLIKKSKENLKNICDMLRSYKLYNILLTLKKIFKIDESTDTLLFENKLTNNTETHICLGSDLKNKKLIRFLNKDMKHNEFTYKLGENIDILPFDQPYDEYSEGLHFIEQKYVFEYIGDYDFYYDFIATVIVDDDEQICVGYNQCKAHKITITKIEPTRTYLNNLSEDDLRAIIFNHKQDLELVCDTLCALGLNDILLLIKKMYKITISPEAFDMTAGNGYCDTLLLLQYVCYKNKKIDGSTGAFDMAISKGHNDMVIFLQENFPVMKNIYDKYFSNKL